MLKNTHSATTGGNIILSSFCASPLILSIRDVFLQSYKLLTIVDVRPLTFSPQYAGSLINCYLNNLSSFFTRMKVCRMANWEAGVIRLPTLRISKRSI